MSATDNNLDFGKVADAELNGEMSRGEIIEALQILFFSGNRAARKTLRIDSEVRKYLVDVLKTTTRSGA